jgi:hypothetical protein
VASAGSTWTTTSVTPEKRSSRPFLDAVADAVRVGERRLGRDEHVQVDVHVVARAARANVVRLEHARLAQRFRFDVGRRDAALVRQRRQRRLENFEPRLEHEQHDDRRCGDVRPGDASALRDEARDHEQRGEQIAARVRGVGDEQLALEALALRDPRPRRRSG